LKEVENEDVNRATDTTTLSTIYCTCKWGAKAKGHQPHPDIPGRRSKRNWIKTPRTPV